jgi:hypothetical protein
MSVIPSIIEDPRDILCVVVNRQKVKVGELGVTKIKAYWDNGHQWLAIYVGEIITGRVNINMITGVEYE